jgi:hypothetical protein
MPDIVEAEVSSAPLAEDEEEEDGGGAGSGADIDKALLSQYYGKNQLRARDFFGWLIEEARLQRLHPSDGVRFVRITCPDRQNVSP